MKESWDHSSHEEFLAHYAEKSQSAQDWARFRSIRDNLLRFLRSREQSKEFLDVADIGCGPGTQSILWAELGHHVRGLDVNSPMLELARNNAARAGCQIDFQLGSAVSLPWASESVDVCLEVELLEHVADWGSCLREAVRILRPGGALFVSTTNALCPRQSEFNLPVYSWYPAPIKRHYERLALTTRPELANHAKYPAVHWFTPYELGSWLRNQEFSVYDRFDLIHLDDKPALARLLVQAALALPPLRFLGHVCTASTAVLAIKRGVPLQVAS